MKEKELEVEEVITPEDNQDPAVEPVEETTEVDEQGEAEGVDKTNPEEELSENEDVEVEETEDVDEEPQGDKIVIDDKEYSEEEIEKMLLAGKKVYEYQKEHPGWDPILLNKQYTQVSQELAKYKRSISDGENKEPSAPRQPAPKQKQNPDVDLSEFDKEQVDTFNKIAKALGFVSKDELENLELQKRQQSYEQVKKQQIDSFIEKYPQYHPENDPGDAQWNRLKEEFGLYKLPDDPGKFYDLLEKAHTNISGSSSSVDAEKVKNIIAKKRVQKQAQTSSADGGSEGTTKTKSLTGVEKLARSGGLKGFSDKEFDELFN
jgi:hypothetical protein